MRYVSCGATNQHHHVVLAGVHLGVQVSLARLCGTSHAGLLISIASGLGWRALRCPGLPGHPCGTFHAGLLINITTWHWLACTRVSRFLAHSCGTFHAVSLNHTTFTLAGVLLRSSVALGFPAVRFMRGHIHGCGARQACTCDASGQLVGPCGATSLWPVHIFNTIGFESPASAPDPPIA